MKIITFEDIKNLNISPTTCYEWVEDMLLNKKKAVLPSKISMKWTDGVFCNVMPCVLMDERNSAGVKVVTRYPERIPSLDSDLVIFDSETGEFLAFMDANWITAMRTGAVAAHSIMLLAKKNFSKLSFLGLGNTARAALLVLASMMPEKEFTKGKEFKVNKIYVLIKELRNSLSQRDKKLFLIKYIDLMENINTL